MIVTRCPIFTRLGLAFVYFMLTIGAFITSQTPAFMSVVLVKTLPAVQAHFRNGNSLVSSGYSARNSFHVAQNARPLLGAIALECVAGLGARASIFAGSSEAPVHVSLALFASVSIWAVTRVVPNVVGASSIVPAWV